MTLGPGSFRLPGIGEHCGKIFPVLMQCLSRWNRVKMLIEVKTLIYRNWLMACNLFMEYAADFDKPRR